MALIHHWCFWIAYNSWLFRRSSSSSSQTHFKLYVDLKNNEIYIWAWTRGLLGWCVSLSLVTVMLLYHPQTLPVTLFLPCTFPVCGKRTGAALCLKHWLLRTQTKIDEENGWENRSSSSVRTQNPATEGCVSPALKPHSMTLLHNNNNNHNNGENSTARSFPVRDSASTRLFDSLNNYG